MQVNCPWTDAGMPSKKLDILTSIQTFRVVLYRIVTMMLLN